MEDIKHRIKTFLSSKAYAVIGASNDRNKYGNKVLRCYLQHHLTVFPVNPKEEVIEHLKNVKKLSELPNHVESISIITPPEVTKQIVDEAIEKGIKNIWMQPGSENQSAIEKAIKHGINVIANGPCILVELGFHL